MSVPRIASTSPWRVRSLFSKLTWHWPVLLAYAAWVLLIGSHHEPWFDEAQAWLIARDSDLWQMLSQRVRYEGTPGLWHLILWFAIRAGLPYSCFYLVPAAFAISGAAVVLWRAPFPPLLRGAILCSYFVGYQYSVVARSYSVDLLLIPLAAAFFARRTERPLRYAIVLAAMANLNAHGFLLAGVLGLEFVWCAVRTKRVRVFRVYGSGLLAFALACFAAWTAWQPADNGYIQGVVQYDKLALGVNFLMQAFVDRATMWRDMPRDTVEFVSGLCLTLVFLYPFFQFMLFGPNRLLAWSTTGILIGFSALVYGSPWHAGLLFLIWILLLWTGWQSPLVGTSLRGRLMVSMALICLVQAIETVHTGIWDLRHVFSPGREVAEAITDYRNTHPAARIDGYGFKSFEVQPWLTGNPYDNYHHGAALPAYLSWKKSETWPTWANQDNWRQTLEGRADWIVGSGLDVKMWTQSLIPMACSMGYRVHALFAGEMRWRGAAVQNQSMWIFEKAPEGDACFVSHPPVQKRG